MKIKKTKKNTVKPVITEEITLENAASMPTNCIEPEEVLEKANDVKTLEDEILDNMESDNNNDGVDINSEIVNKLADELIKEKEKLLFEIGDEVKLNRLSNPNIKGTYNKDDIFIIENIWKNKDKKYQVKSLDSLCIGFVNETMIHKI